MAKTFTGRQIMDAIGIRDDSYGADLTLDAEANTSSLACEDVATQLQRFSKAAGKEAGELVFSGNDVRELIDSARQCIAETGVLELPEPVGPAAKRGIEGVLGKLEALLPVPVNGKAVLDAIGIDETFESDMKKGTVDRTIDLLKERILMDVRVHARIRGSSIVDARFEHHDLATLIDSTRMWTVKNGYEDLPDPLGGAIRDRLHGVYSSLEALLPLAEEA